MDPDQLAAAVGRQFVTAWNAPVPFLAALLAGWLILRWHIKGQFDTKLTNAQSTIDLRDRQLQDYKDKLDGATPDAAKARIDALEERIENRLNALEPRSISDNQRATMTAVLDSFAGCHVSIAYDAGLAEARTLAQKLTAAFHAARWTATNPMVIGVGNPPPSGIAFRVPEAENLTEPQRAILAAFRAAAIGIDVQGGYQNHQMPNEPLVIADIVVTSPLV